MTAARQCSEEHHARLITAIEDPRWRGDAETARALLREVTGMEPVMWGTSTVGYGRYRGPAGDWPIIGVSPRNAHLVFYIMTGFAESGDLLARLGKHKTGAGCLYVSRMDDVDQAVLRELAIRSVAWMRERHPPAG